MGATIIAIAVGSAVVAAGALLLTGVYYGVKCVVHIIKETFFTRVETSGKGSDMAKVADGLNKDLNAHNIKKSKEEEEKLQQTINEIKNDHEHIYKVSTKIERTDGEFIHTIEEKDLLVKINDKFNKSYTHKEEYINICDFGDSFGDEYFILFSKVGWESIIELNLINNNITQIEPLYKINLLNLQNLDLSNNLISDIDDFDQIQIQSLKSINLKNNKINDPLIFIVSKFETLDELNLENNDIDDDDKKIFSKKFKSRNKSSNLNLLL